MEQQWKEQYDSYLRAAWNARMHAYAPYSNYLVGAALVTQEGDIITGCNVENASYPVGICAERTALVKAVSQGTKHFVAIAIVGGKKDSAGAFCPPCGLCRQMLREFTSPKEFLVLTASMDPKGTIIEKKVQTLEELLPDSFGPDALN